MNNYYINLFRIPKVLLLILAGVLFSINPHVLSSQNLVTCSFDSNPSSTLYTCASNVTAEITTSNLPAGYDQLIIFYPLQFELVSVNNMPPPVNPVLASFSFDPPVGEEVLVQGQQIEFPVLSNTVITYEFAVRSCYPQNGTAPQSYPAYFEAYVSNGTPDHIEAIFSQPQQYFGANGIVQFSNISTQPFTLSSNQDFPTILNPGDNFDRDLIVTLNSQNIQGFAININQEWDVIHQNLKIKNAQGTFINLPFSSSLPIITSQIDDNILSQLNLDNPIIIRQFCKLQCDDEISNGITNFNVSLLCGDCDPIAQSFLFDAQTGVSRPFSISQTVVDNTAINSNCSTDFNNLVTIDFDESDLEFVIPSIQIPINSDFFNLNFIRIGGVLIPSNPTFYNINSNNILTIDLDAIANSGNNLQIPPLVLDNSAYITPSGAFSLEIELGMSYIISAFQTCLPGVYFYRITDNTNTIVKQHKLIKQ